MKKKLITIALSLFLSLGITNFSLAASCQQDTECTPPQICDNGACKAASTKTVKCPSGKGECIALENPIGQGPSGTTDVTVLIGTIIKAALGIIGSLTLLMLVWGGFQWLTSAGNPEKVKKGSQTMVWAIIGVVLVFASYLILTTYLNYLTGGGK